MTRIQVRVQLRTAVLLVACSAPSILAKILRALITPGGVVLACVALMTCPRGGWAFEWHPLLHSTWIQTDKGVALKVLSTGDGFGFITYGNHSSTGPVLQARNVRIARIWDTDSESDPLFTTAFSVAYRRERGRPSLGGRVFILDWLGPRVLFGPVFMGGLPGEKGTYELSLSFGEAGGQEGPLRGEGIVTWRVFGIPTIGAVTLGRGAGLYGRVAHLLLGLDPTSGRHSSPYPRVAMTWNQLTATWPGLTGTVTAWGLEAHWRLGRTFSAGPVAGTDMVGMSALWDVGTRTRLSLGIVYLSSSSLPFNGTWLTSWGTRRD